ncbi:hypothetical protein MTBSS4_210106 [Magnetospirillum sp. SS-4]|nr:hypothetical protein MTBSS4_210106 [Magnetospirillum sp. SS-4]
MIMGRSMEMPRSMLGLTVSQLLWSISVCLFAGGCAYPIPLINTDALAEPERTMAFNRILNKSEVGDSITYTANTRSIVGSFAIISASADCKELHETFDGLSRCPR